MRVADEILETIGLLNGLLAHFVNAPGAVFTQAADGQWTAVGLTVPTLTAKGNSLMGAVADIILYVHTLQDFIRQVLVGTTVAGSPLP